MGDVARAHMVPTGVRTYMHVCQSLHLCLPSFPECPERLHAIKEQLILESLLDRCVSFQVNSCPRHVGGGQGTGRI